MNPLVGYHDAAQHKIVIKDKADNDCVAKTFWGFQIKVWFSRNMLQNKQIVKMLAGINPHFLVFWISQISQPSSPCDCDNVYIDTVITHFNLMQWNFIISNYSTMWKNSNLLLRTA